MKLTLKTKKYVKLKGELCGKSCDVNEEDEKHDQLDEYEEGGDNDGSSRGEEESKDK